MAFVNGAALRDYATRGNAAPDHSIRIKRFGVVLPAPDASDLGKFKTGVHTAIADYVPQPTQTILTATIPDPGAALLCWTQSQGSSMCPVSDCLASAKPPKTPPFAPISPRPLSTSSRRQKRSDALSLCPRKTCLILNTGL